MTTFDAGSIEATADLDGSPFRRALQDMKREGERFAQNKFSPKLDADDSEFRRKINAAKLSLASLAGTTKVNVGLDGNVDEQLAGIKASTSALNGSKVKISVNIAGYAVANRQLTRLTQLASALDGKTISFRADADTSAASARIAALQAQLNALNNNNNGGGGGGPGGGGGTGGGAGGLMAPNRLLDLAAAGLTAAAALAPVITVLGGVTAGLVSMGATAGGAGLILGAAFKGAITHYQDVKKETAATSTALAQQKAVLAGMTPGTAAYAAQLLKVAEAQKAADAATAKAGPGFLFFDRRVTELKNTWQSFIKATQANSFAVMGTALSGVSSLLARMAPIANALMPIFYHYADAFRNWANGPGGTAFINMLATTGVSSFRNLAVAAAHVATTVGQLVKSFAPLGGSISLNIRDLSERLSNWAKGGGFDRFMATVRKDGPMVATFFRDAFTLVGRVSQSLNDLGPAALLGVGGLIKLANALPRPVLTALIGLFIVWRAAVMAHRIQVALSTDFIGRNRLMIIAHRVSTAAATAATWLWNAATRAAAVAQRLLSAAFLSSPIGWLVLAIAGLVVAFVLLWNKCDAFRNFWKGLWSNIQNIAGSVWNWLKDNWKLCVNIIIGVIMGPLAAGLFYIITHWNQVKSALGATWNFIRDNIFAPIGRFFTVTIPGWANTVYSRVRQSWINIQNSVNGVKNFLVNNIFAPIGRFFTSTIPGWANTVKDRVNQSWQNIQNTINGVKNFLVNNIFNPIGRFFTNTIPGWANTVYARVRQSWVNIQNSVNSVKNFLVNNIFNPIGRFFTSTIPGWANTVASRVKQSWENIKSSVSSVFNWVKSHVFSPLGNFFTKTIPGWATTVKDKTVHAFNLMKEGIGHAFAAIKKLAADPINFVIDTVYNGGIVKVWNVIANAVGLKDKKLSPVSKIKFAEGGTFAGRVSGGGTGKSDSIDAKLGANEHVWTAAEVQGAGGHAQVARMRSQALGGQKVRAYAGAGTNRFVEGGGVTPPPGLPATKPNPMGSGDNGDSGLGGIISGAKHVIGDVVGGVASFAKKIVRGAIGAVANPLLNGIESGIDHGIPKTGFGVLANPVAKQPIEWIKDWIKKDDESHMGGKGVQDALAFANAQIGKPYQYGGGMDPSFDCSSFMSSIAKVILGQDPHGRVWSTMDFQGKSAPAGWEWHKDSPFKIGVTNGPGGTGGKEGHTAGTLAGVNYEATPPVLRKGPGARGFNDPMFTDWYGFMPALNAGGAGGGAANVQNWKSVVMQALAAAGESPSHLNDVLATIAKESGGNSNAINKTDSNAVAGTPSKGLMQVIDPTFNTYAGQFRSRGIYDPLANIYAAIQYAKAYYGSGWSQRMAQPGGYAGGTMSALAGMHPVAENGPELVSRQGLKSFVGGERVFNARETRSLVGGGNTTQVVPSTVIVQIGEKQFVGTVVDIVDDTMGEAGRSRG